MVDVNVDHLGWEKLVMNYNVFKVVEVIMVIVRMVNVSVNQDGLAVYAI